MNENWLGKRIIYYHFINNNDYQIRSGIINDYDDRTNRPLVFKVISDKDINYIVNQSAIICFETKLARLLYL